MRRGLSRSFRCQYRGLPCPLGSVPCPCRQPDGPIRGRRAGACLLTPASVFAELGGFTMSLASNWQDVDYCLKARAAGLQNIWTPQAVLTHFESVTRNPRVLDTERMWLHGRWAKEILTDPFFSPADRPTGPMWPVEWYR